MMRHSAQPVYTVTAEWDAEAGVWVATTRRFPVDAAIKSRHWRMPC